MFHGADRAVEALLRGQESANLLKTVLEHQRTSSVSIEPLFDTLLDSFSFALSLFASSNTQPHRDSSQSEATPVTARKSPKKNSHGEEGLEQYNHDSPTPICNDGFPWRKYGQKKIKTSSHQRCYYRCAYAKDRNCNATKRPNEDIVNGSKMIRFDKTDQGMPDPVMPQLVPVEQEALIIEGADQIMNLECGSNEFLVDDDQLWEYQFPPCSPGDFMFLDDLSEFDYNPFHV
ncbi:hypothetical protein YC2023_023700 [Brassica napus]